MATEVTSCAPLAEIARGSRDALCSHLVDPFVSISPYILLTLNDVSKFSELEINLY